jgi:hypothetical protein
MLFGLPLFNTSLLYTATVFYGIFAIFAAVYSNGYVQQKEATRFLQKYIFTDGMS